MNKRNNKYIVQNGCHNCKNCFVFSDWDSILEYYCNHDNNRPKCGSVALGENFDWKRKDMDEYKAWDKWSKKNQVSPCGICNKFEKDGLTM